MNKDLGDVIYGKVSKDLFVETHSSEFLCSVVCIVHKTKFMIFKDSFEKVIDKAVVPGSCTSLNLEDRDGNQLFRVVVFKHSVDNFLNEIKKAGYAARRFEFNEEQHKKDEEQKVRLEQRIEAMKVMTLI